MSKIKIPMAHGQMRSKYQDDIQAMIQQYTQQFSTSRDSTVRGLLRQKIDRLQKLLEGV